MEFKGDIEIVRTGVFGRRADQGLNADTITGDETSLVRHSAYWQSLSAENDQDVNLPDATTLPNGWEVVIHATGAADLKVKDDTSADTIGTVESGKASRFTCIDNSDEDGTWYVSSVATSEEGAAERYTLTHDATTDWGSAAGGYYTITTTAATHGRGTRPMVQFYETVSTDEIEVSPDSSLFVTSSGDHSFRVTEDPEGRYAGKVIFI